MFEILKGRTYRHLFLAQVVALLGTGLATVALALLAHDLAGGDAGLVLGTAFAIKMVAYVTVAPLASAFAERLPRRRLLVAFDLVRAAAALALPFVTAVWQIYLIIFILQAASAAFTPTFQATIPDVLPEEERYTRALSLSRLAYDLESLLSPILAALLLVFLSFDTLFAGTVVGFLASACLVVSVALPNPRPAAPRSFYDRTSRGIRIYLATPRLRGLLAFSMTVSAAGAMVLVNTVVIVRDGLGLSESAVAFAMAAFGAGSMVSALALPHLLDRLDDRPVMTAGALLMLTGLLGFAVWAMIFDDSQTDLMAVGLILAWPVVGLGYSAVLTPSGRLLRRSSQPEDRPAVFAAQFALSHGCWLITYPLAGWLMTVHGLLPALIVLAATAMLSLVLALRAWPASDPIELEHEHPDLPPDHPHVRDGHRHAHAFTVDDLHRSWPTSG